MTAAVVLGAGATTTWVVVLVVVIALAVVAVCIAYSRGRGLAVERVPQYDQAAAAQAKQKLAEAQAELDKIAKEAADMRAALESVKAIQDEAARLKALADFANRNKGRTP